MKRIIFLGIVLITVIYVAPFLYNEYYDRVIQTVGIGENPPADGENLSGSTHTDMPSAGADAVDFGDTITIKAQISGEVRTMGLEEYVAGVVASEISPVFQKEALKAQAVAARTYIVYKLQNGGNKDARHNGADVCDDYTHCTAYQDIGDPALWGDKHEPYRNNIVEAVLATRGEILEYDGEPIVAVFHAASSGSTERALDVWGSDIPYLQAVSSEGDLDCPEYSGTVTVPAEEFRKKMTEKYPGIYVKGAPDTWFTASNRSESGGIITATVGGVEVKGTDIRSLFSLSSTNFTLKTTEDSITFVTKGYGHGVGLSQYGAEAMAEEGHSYREILAHYYQNTKIEKFAK